MINKLMTDYRQKTDTAIDLFFPQCNKEYSAVIEAARYSLTLGGKRIRPIIMLLFAKLCGGKEAEILPFAVALEMIHTYSLIHDDLPCMDNDDMRRGKPSCHKAFGEDTALLAGDALLTYAFEVASKTKGASKDNVIKAIGVLAKNAGYAGMIGGQVIDLAIENTPCDIETIKEMYLLKTGELLCAAAEIGCILAGADGEKISAARRYAQNVGLAFQIIDDILDNIGDEKLLGKPVGSDQKNNKTTFVSKYGIEECRNIAARLTETAKEALNTFEGDKTNIVALTNYLLERNY